MANSTSAFADDVDDATDQFEDLDWKSLFKVFEDGDEENEGLKTLEGDGMLTDDERVKPKIDDPSLLELLEGQVRDDPRTANYTRGKGRSTEKPKERTRSKKAEKKFGKVVHHTMTPRKETIFEKVLKGKKGDRKLEHYWGW